MALPPPKPPLKPGLARPASSEDALAKAKREKDELESEVQGAEEELEALKAKYDAYFLGIERREPNRWRDDIRKKVLRLKTAFTRNTGLRFRIQSLHARYLSYERLWLRNVREKEEGTYRRDLFKARLRHHEEPGAPEGNQAPVAPPPSAAAAAAQKPAQSAKSAAPVAQLPKGAPGAKAPSPASAARPPGAVSRPPPAAAPPGGMGEAQMRALYDAYRAAKVTCREDVSRLTYDAVAKTVSKQIPELMTRYKAKTVEFKVEVKDGKAILKAIPKG